jgi:hypothetical protein
MVIAQDVQTHRGTLIVPRGFEVTPLFVERSRNFGPDLLDQVVRVVVPAGIA